MNPSKAQKAANRIMRKLSPYKNMKEGDLIRTHSGLYKVLEKGKDSMILEATDGSGSRTRAVPIQLSYMCEAKFWEVATTKKEKAKFLLKD